MKKPFVRLTYRLAFRRLGLWLVLCALVGGIYQSRLHTVYALCAAGTCLLAAAWLGHLKKSSLLPSFGRRLQARRAPFLLRKPGVRTWHKPAFIKDSRDFDDDLGSITLANREDFSDAQLAQADALARCACGLMLLAVSIIVYV